MHPYVPYRSLCQARQGASRSREAGELGQRIPDEVSAEGYELWKPHLTTIINHYGLNPADPEVRAMLRNEMESFFFGEGATQTADLTPETVKAAE